MNANEAGRQVKTFAVPDLGEGLEDVTITAWNVAVGDQVELNQVLCTVETAKAEVEIPSPYAGRVIELGGAPGDVLAVGAVLIRIATGPEVDPGPGRPDPAATSAADGETGARTPVLVGYGADGALDASRRTRPARLKAKPAARRLAAELGVDLDGVPPGPAGVITVDEVRAAAGAGADARPTAGAEGADYDVVTPGPVQTTMAERMMLAHSRIPDAQARVEVDCGNLLRLRDELADPAGPPITPFVLTLRLLVIALSRHRILNSTWVDAPDGPQVRTHRAVHLGFAVAAPRGLLVPVVADAQRLTTRELADRVARLIADARAGTLAPADLRGSTFTVSNFGALGLDDGVPVINYPEAAILGVGSVRPRPAVVGDAVVARQQMMLTCVFDHRIADGAQAAQFLCLLRDLIEAPETALLDL